MAYGGYFANQYLTVDTMLRTEEGRELVALVGYDRAKQSIANELNKQMAVYGSMVYASAAIVVITAGAAIGIFGSASAAASATATNAPSVYSAVMQSAGSSVGSSVGGGASALSKAAMIARIGSFGVMTTNAILNEMYRRGAEDRETDNLLMSLNNKTDLQLRDLGYNDADISAIRAYSASKLGVGDTNYTPNFDSGGNLSSFMSLYNSLLNSGVAPNQALKQTAISLGWSPDEETVLQIYYATLADAQKRAELEKREEEWLLYTRGMTQTRDAWAIEDRVYDVAMQQFRLQQADWAVEDRQYELDKQGAWYDDREYNIQVQDFNLKKQDWAIEDREYDIATQEYNTELRSYNLGTQEYYLQQRFYEVYDNLRGRGVDPDVAMQQASAISGYSPEDEVSDVLLADADAYLQEFVGAYKTSDVYEMIQDAVNNQQQIKPSLSETVDLIDFESNRSSSSINSMYHSAGSRYNSAYKYTGNEKDMAYGRRYYRRSYYPRRSYGYRRYRRGRYY